MRNLTGSQVQTPKRWSDVLSCSSASDESGGCILDPLQRIDWRLRKCCQNGVAVLDGVNPWWVEYLQWVECPRWVAPLYFVKTFTFFQSVLKPEMQRNLSKPSNVTVRRCSTVQTVLPKRFSVKVQHDCGSGLTMRDRKLSCTSLFYCSCISS